MFFIVFDFNNSDKPKIIPTCTSQNSAKVSILTLVLSFNTNYHFMCGRYVLIEKIEFYAEQFKVKAPALPNQFLPNYNVSIGNFAPIITNDKPFDI
mgnify:CR=1 FL=1